MLDEAKAFALFSLSLVSKLRIQTCARFMQTTGNPKQTRPMKKTTTNLLHTLCLASVLIVMPYSMPAQVVINGSFEQGTDPGNNVAVFAGDSTTITGWTVQSGSVDYVGTRWMAADGNRSLDLSGQSAGSILQNAVNGFTVGMQYRLSFYMAANTEGGSAIKSLQADIGSVSQSFSFDGTGHSASDMGWSLRTLDFVATATSLNLDLIHHQPPDDKTGADKGGDAPCHEQQLWTPGHGSNRTARLQLVTWRYSRGRNVYLA